MSEYVRVRQLETGHQLSVPKPHADAVGVGVGYEVLDKPAVDAAGDPLPPKYHTTIAPAAGSDAETEGYGALTVKQLKGEIAGRNADRDGDALLSDKGNKPTLIAVLEEDDAAAASAPTAAEPGDDTDASDAPATDSQPTTDGQQAETTKENA